MNRKKGIMNLYGRNNMVMMLSDKIYGSLGSRTTYVTHNAKGKPPLVLHNTLQDSVVGIEMQGWTEQNQYEGKNLWNFEQSIEFERVVRMTFDEELPAGEYTFSAVVHSTDTDDSQCLLIFLTADGGQMAYYIGRSNGDSRVSAKISMSIPAAAISLYASTLNVTSEGDTASFVDIMLNAGDTPLPYEPYTGGQPSPSPDYPQEITSAGKYDEGTGKYQYTIKISDSEESPTKSQTVTLTSDRPLTKWDRLEERDGQWGWVYKSAEIVCDGSETWFLTSATSDEYQGFALKSSDYNAMKSNLRLVCDKFAYSTSDKINTCRQEKSEYGLRFVVSIEYVPNKTVADWENWLQSNPITVLYQLAEPTFVPLSESEQELMNALYTFRPTTVLSNDQDCVMKITYKASE